MLDLRLLRYFVSLSRRLSYARAADDLGISQSALTRAIQSLEQQCDMRLFDRDRAGVRLTPSGLEFADRAAVLLANAEDLERQMRKMARGEEGRVRFGMAPMPARALLPAVLAERLGTAPDATNDVVVRNVDALWPLLVSGEIEFFVSAEGQVPDSPPVRAEVLGHFPISLIVRAGHPLLVEGDAAGRYPVLLASQGGHLLPPDLQAIADGPPHVVEDFAVLAAITAASDAVWLSSTYAVTEELAAGLLRELPRGGEARQLELRMVLYTLERRTQSPALRTIREAMRQRIRALAR